MSKRRTEKRYRKVSSETYADKRFMALSPPLPSGQSLFLYLITGPHLTNIPGLFSAGQAALSEAIGWELDDFRRCFAEIDAAQMVQVDWKARVVFLPNALAHNAPESPNVVKSWAQNWRLIPECPLKQVAAKSLLSGLEALGEAFAAPFREFAGPDAVDRASSKPTKALPEGFTQGLPKGLREGNADPCGNQEQEQEQEQRSFIHRTDEACEGTPVPPQPRKRFEGREQARRVHPLDSPPTQVLSVESLDALDAFVKAYPNKNAAPIAVHRAWLALSPSPALAERILRDLDERKARGWGVSDVKFLPAPHNWLRDQHWLKPLPDAPAAAAPVDIEGRALLSECVECGGSVRGLIREGNPVYEPCPVCTSQKAMVS